jgi:signal transduction histidine kinase
MHGVANLSRHEFNDLVPALLLTLNDRLQYKASTTDSIATAAEHGLHRWHKGYHLQELLGEIEHLRQGLLSEISAFWQYYPQTPAPVIQEAYEQVSQLFGEAVQGSVLKYEELKANTAAGRMNSLQLALANLSELEQERARLLRMTSHDLRGGISIVSGAASRMTIPDISDQEREDMMAMMQRNLGNVRQLLEKLSDITRLEAGQDKLEIESVDVADLLRNLIESAQQIATERGLLVQADGPDTMLVKTDRLKIQRIVQNLLLNALKYTPSSTEQPGWVSVSWMTEDDYRWFISIQDNGPGLPPGPASRLAATLAPISEPASIFQAQEEIKSVAAPVASFSEGGEGLGLHIVKQLCEALHATLEVEISEGKGTLFRVQIPHRNH